MASRACSVISNWTGYCVFRWRTIARLMTRPPWTTSRTRIDTKSQLRSLLSTARLNSARSRSRPGRCSRIRIPQISLGFRGGFRPMSLPLFQGGRRESEGWRSACSGKAIVDSFLGQKKPDSHHVDGSAQIFPKRTVRTADPQVACRPQGVLPGACFSRYRQLTSRAPDSNRLGAHQSVDWVCNGRFGAELRWVRFCPRSDARFSGDLRIAPTC